MTGTVSRDRILAFLLPAALLAAWQLSTSLGLISGQILPTPAVVLSRLQAMVADGSLLGHLGWSLRRVVLGFAAGAGIGLILGIAMALSRTAKDYLYPTFSIFIYVPVLAWLPILMLFLGLGETLKVILIAKAVLVPVTIQTFNAVRDVPAGLVEVAQVNRLSRTQTMLLVILPAAFPLIWAGLRYGHSRGWSALVIVEILASSEGLGFLMTEGQQLLQLDLLVVGLIALGTIGFVLDRLLALPNRWINRWRQDGFVRASA